VLLLTLTWLSPIEPAWDCFSFWVKMCTNWSSVLHRFRLLDKCRGVKCMYLRLKCSRDEVENITKCKVLKNLSVHCFSMYFLPSHWHLIHIHSDTPLEGSVTDGKTHNYTINHRKTICWSHLGYYYWVKLANTIGNVIGGCLFVQ